MRPGNLALSMVAFCGLSLLASFLWELAAGYVLLLLIPALAVSLYQMILSPVRGLRVSEETLTILCDGEIVNIPVAAIDHISVAPDGAGRPPRLVLRSGEEIALPFDLTGDQRDMVRHLSPGPGRSARAVVLP